MPEFFEGPTIEQGVDEVVHEFVPERDPITMESIGFDTTPTPPSTSALTGTLCPHPVGLVTILAKLL